MGLEEAQARVDELLQQQYDFDAQISALRDQKRTASQELATALDELEAEKRTARLAEVQSQGETVVPVGTATESSEGGG